MLLNDYPVDPMPFVEYLFILVSLLTALSSVTQSTFTEFELHRWC